MSFDIDAVNFEKVGGIATIIAQHAVTGEVLMVAGADRVAVERTIESGEMHYHSRSRGLWHKGATSGNIQRVISLTLDCDTDSILALVIPAGPACHNGTMSCFQPRAFAGAISAVDDVISKRQAHPAPASYTNRLLDDRNLRLKKIGEEAAELITALADGDKTRATEEAADLLYHMLVALRAVGTGLDEVQSVLAARR